MMQKVESTKSLFGRVAEQAIFKKVLTSQRAELLAVYGRRRVGKTFLINSCFAAQENYFEVTGKKTGNTKKQLEVFKDAFSDTFYNVSDLNLSDWKPAFNLLYKEAKEHKSPFVVFFDELPWLASKRSGLLEELEHFWNTKFSKLDHFKLILCGSAASWMLKKIIHNKGGLHSRLTYILPIEPFSIAQANQLLERKGVNLSQQQLIELYMIIGGIPFYLDLVPAGLSVNQIVAHLFFSSQAILKHEFQSLFSSLFGEDRGHEKVVTTLANHRYGLTAKRLKDRKILAGGTLTRVLRELEAAGFIRKYIPYGKNSKYAYYRLVDEYTLFLFELDQTFAK